MARVRGHIRRIGLRSLHISSACFNLNAFSEEEALAQFRFRKSEVGTVCRVVSWNAERGTRNARVAMDTDAIAYPRHVSFSSGILFQCGGAIWKCFLG